MKATIVGVMTGVAVLWLAAGGASAQNLAQPLTATLALDKTGYLSGDPNDAIRLTLTLRNEGSAGVITSQGFSARDFHLSLLFTDPDGNPVRATAVLSEPAQDPEPPMLIPGQEQPLQGEPVEILPPGWTLSVVIPRAQDYYLLEKAGHWSVRAVIPMRTYSAVYATVNGQGYALIDSADWAGNVVSNPGEFNLLADADGDGFSYPLPDPRLSSQPLPDCQDADPLVNPGCVEVPGNGIDDDCDPASPDSIPTPPGTVIIKASRHAVGTGSHPPSSKTPIAGMEVRVFSAQAGSCLSRFGVAWQNYKSVWLSCAPEAGGIAETDASGMTSLSLPAGDYVGIGLYDPDTSLADDELYPGVRIGPLDPSQTVQKFLQLIAKADGKTVPAKYTVRKGSELLIIEPEYIEWSSTQELYPFIFESVGSWGVLTSVIPPEGFEVDTPSLATLVNSSIQALQFTVTDVGSAWVPTKVRHVLTHKRKIRRVRSTVGVKLSGRLARAKGLDRFGRH